MRRTLNQFFLAAALVAGGLSLAGCKQAAGERCEVASDCAAGLLCVGDPSSSICSSSALQPDAAPATDTRASTGDGPAPTTGDTAGPDQAAPTDVAVTGDAPAPAPADAAPATPPDLAADLSRTSSRPRTAPRTSRRACDAGTAAGAGGAGLDPGRGRPAGDRAGGRGGRSGRLPPDRPGGRRTSPSTSASRSRCRRSSTRR